MKRPGGSYKPTPAQLEFIEEVRKRGGYAGVVRSVEDVDRVFQSDGAV